jgi:hypothetical protein
MIRALCIALLVGGCVKAQQRQPIWLGAGGQSKLDTDKVICQGQASAAVANNPGGLMSTGSIIGDVVSQMRIDQNANNVMLGCMAEHGWRLQEARAR